MKRKTIKRWHFANQVEKKVTAWYIFNRRKTGSVLYVDGLAAVVQFFCDNFSDRDGGAVPF